MKNNISKSKIIIAVISVTTALAVFISIGWYFSYQENTNELRRLSNYISEFRYGPQPTYVTFGKYEQDGNVLNGKEDIEWKVILVNSGQVFLVSRCILDCKPFFSESGKEEMTATGGADVPKSIWETSSLRKWLNEDFYESHLWKKSNLILLVYYLYSKEIPNRLDYKINYAKLFTPPKQDIEIIKNDYNIIVNKIRNGKAHELSEGDTMYLGAATKAATSANSRKQPFSDIPAKPRAFSFKVSYMTHILNTYIVPNKTTYEPIIKNIDELKNKTFEEYITNKINIHIGKSDKELCELFNREYNNNK